MVYKARLLISGRQKIALVLLLAAIAVFLAYYPRITEALLAFLLGGVVPGTDIIVSPEIVLLLILGVFIVGTAILVIRMYLKAAQGRRNFRITVQAIESVAVLPVARDTVIATDTKVGVEISTAVRRRHATAMFLRKLFGSVRHVVAITGGTIENALRTASHAVSRILGFTGRSIWKGIGFTAEAIFTLLVLGWYGVEATAKLLMRFTVRIARLMARNARRLWRWSLPRLQRFDRWLELQIRRLETAAGKRIGSHEAVRSVAAMSRAYRKSFDGIHAKTALRSAHQKAGAMQPKVLPPRGRGSQLKG